jgi:L-lactate dehydrogenase complex protein LldG
MLFGWRQWEIRCILATMSDREKILSAVKEALADLPPEKRTPYPEWDASMVVSRRAPAAGSHEDKDALWETFKEHFQAVHGDPLDSLAAIPGFLAERECKTGFVDPELLPRLIDYFDAAPQEFELLTCFDRDQVNDYDFGITRAAGLIAESGSILLKDRLTSARLAVLAPWLHLAIVPGDAIFPTVTEALASFDDDPYITLATGPSKTADIEGILIEGVHGPGVEAVCRI